MFDLNLFCLVAGVLIAVRNPDAFNEQGADVGLPIFAIFAWVFVESLFLSTIGTTSGKWLFKTQLVPPLGPKLSYFSALSRSFKVWWRGLGIGFPIASFITLIVAHGNITKHGVTSWDKDGGFTVVHHRIGPLRVIAAILFFLAFLLLIVLGNAANT